MKVDSFFNEMNPSKVIMRKKNIQIEGNEMKL